MSEGETIELTRCVHGKPFAVRCHICYRAANPRRKSRAAVRLPAANGKPKAPAQRPPLAMPAPCRHGGQRPAGEQECPSCGQDAEGRAKVRVTLFSCAVHGQCTAGKKLDGIACCKGCKDYAPTEGLKTPAIRNLLYHIWPKRGSFWRESVDALCKRMWLFNGRRVVSIVTSPNAESADEVKRAFGGAVEDYLVFPNDPNLREVVSFAPLLERVQTSSPREAIFFAHSKGVIRDKGTMCHRWAKIMFETCLDYWPLVEEQLKTHPLAGPFKKVGRGFTGSRSLWHYSGTFFWMRSADVFRRDWKKVDQQWWGAESWAGLHYRAAEAGCLFHSGTVPQLDLYEPSYMESVEAEYERWKSEHAVERMAAHVAG